MTIKTDSLKPNTTKSEGITNDKDTTVQDEDAVARWDERKKQPDRPTNAQMLKPLYLIDKVSCDQRNGNGTTKW